MKYPEHESIMADNYLLKPLGELMQPIHTLIYENDTIAKALTILRKKNIDHKVIYFYVIDEEEKLVGVAPTRKLLLGNPNTLIKEVMETPVVRLHENQTLKDAMEVFAKRGLLALPVVNRENKIIGLVDIETYLEESFDIADSQHRRDMFQFVGLTLEDEKHISPLRDYRFRMPWILCNMLGGIICAIISHFYEIVLGKIVLLAMFIPLVLTLSESVSMQSMTHSLQFLRHPRVTWKYIFLKALREEKITGLIALTCGCAVGMLSILWGDGFWPSAAIGFSIIISISVSSTFGFSLPIILNKSRLDPKVASGPVVLMFSDILTTLIYLSLAAWWLL